MNTQSGEQYLARTHQKLERAQIEPLCVLKVIDNAARSGWPVSKRKAI